MSSRSLIDCNPAMAACAAEFEEQLRCAGIDFVRACTYRSKQEQDTLYAQGRTAPGRILTHARGGESPHNDLIVLTPAQIGIDCGKYPGSSACDYYPLVNGKLCGDQTDAELALWEKIGTIGEACGLDWGGRWPAAKRDRPHFQLKNWRPQCQPSSQDSQNQVPGQASA